MFYLGGVLPGQRTGQCGNCVVDPTSKIANSGEDRAGTSLSYWPSFQSANPTARRTYLDWLAGGREDPDIGIGYVFLFFYGLEHRMFVDRAHSDAPTLIAEVRRLLDLYGHNGSFRGYANRFLDAASLVNAPAVTRPQVSPELRSGYEMPMVARAYLGRKLAAKEPLDAEDALIWILSLPDTRLLTPAVRCFDELVVLWSNRFAARHPDGLKVNPPKTRLKLDYHAASGGFTNKIDISDSSGPLSDIAAISAPLTGLRDLLSACTEELSPYSRLLGKKPEAHGTLEAAMLLPKDLCGKIRSKEAGQRFGHLFGEAKVAEASVSQLAETLSIDLSGLDKIPANISNQIGAYLDFLDIGYEPDKRYGATPLRPEGHVVLFRAQDGGPVDGAASSFTAARAMVDVAALAAGADDRVDADEIATITNEIRQVPDLGRVERARLIAYARTLLKDTSLHRFTLQKLKSLDSAAKQSVVKSATAAVLADGHASPAEVNFLERLYKAMGLPQEDVYSLLHRGAVVVDEPVAIAPEERAPGVAIPRSETEPLPSGIQIDHSRLERLKSETSAVSELLAGIFVEDEAPAAPQPATVPVDDSDARFPDLDAAHANLLAHILQVQPIDRDQFDERARSLRILPDGAIERINDWGFDQFDEPVFEGDDVLTVPSHILDELTETEVAQ